MLCQLILISFGFCKEELTKYPTLDPDITADELVDKIKEDEDADRFTFNEWLNDIDQEIFCV